MVNKTGFLKAYVYDKCVCQCDVCTETFCPHHPQYNWLNPFEPLDE